MDAPEILVQRMNLEERFEKMFCDYFRRNIPDVQFLKFFDYLDIPTDYATVQFSVGSSTGSELPTTELTGYLEERGFSATLAIGIYCRRRTENSKTKIIRKASEIRALMLRGVLFKSPELLGMLDFAGITPQKFGGLEFSGDDNGDSATLQYSFDVILNENVFKQ